MLDLLDKSKTETAIDTATKRSLIEAELRNDATRSDREIARVVGCDHKTVGAARERLGIASPLGNSPPPSDQADVSVAFPHGKVSMPPDVATVVQRAVDQCRGATLRQREERRAEAAKEDESNGEQTMIRSQREVTIQFDDGTGEWVIKQKNWPDDDGAIYINEEHMQAFLDALCDRLAFDPRGGLSHDPSGPDGPSRIGNLDRGHGEIIPA
jgi:hypothetical protein